jgi:RNA polymerase sigma factor (sigma-70 family)
MRRAAAAYLRARGIDAKVADDAVGEVFRRLLQSGVPANVADDKWEAYLVRSATNAAIDEIKKLSRRVDRVDQAGDISETRADQADESTLEDAVIEAVERVRIVDLVRAKVDLLPDAQRRVVAGRHFDGRSNEELATQIGVTSGRISQIHGEGIRRLAGLLAGETP